MDTTFIISHDPKEIAKGQQKQKSQYSLFLRLMDKNQSEAQDKTKHILLGGEDKKKKETNSSQIIVTKTGKETVFEPKKEGFNIQY